MPWYFGVAPQHLPCFIATVLAQGIIYLGAVLLELQRGRARYALAVILGVAVIARLPLVLSTPYLSNDAYRYVWDGRVQARGLNPYRFPPSDPHLKALQDTAIYHNINRREYARTIYPPVAEMLFLAITRVSESIIWMKAGMVIFEALAIWVLIRLLAELGLPGERVIIYAWNPVAMWEFASSGHVDAIAIAFIALALLARKRERSALTGCALACATMVKFYPVLLLPALYRKWDWKMPAVFIATVIVGYAPYLSVGTGVIGFLPLYLKEEGVTNGSRFYIAQLVHNVLKIHTFSRTSCVVAAALVLAIVASFAFVRSSEGPRGWLVFAAAITATALIVFSPHYPWYFAWVLPVLCALPYTPMIYLVTASPLLYLTLMDRSSGTLLRINTLLYLSFAMFVILDLVARRWRGQRFGVISCDATPRETR
jgi:hypothetical protein